MFFKRFEKQIGHIRRLHFLFCFLTGFLKLFLSDLALITDSNREVIFCFESRLTTSWQIKTVYYIKRVRFLHYILISFSNLSFSDLASIINGIADAFFSSELKTVVQ